jgi:hypothetical protein
MTAMCDRGIRYGTSLQQESIFNFLFVPILTGYIHMAKIYIFKYVLHLYFYYILYMLLYKL